MRDEHLRTELPAGPGAAGALRCAEAVRGERRETTYYASARLDGLLRRVEHVSGPRQSTVQRRSAY